MSADTMIDRVRSPDPELPGQFRYELLMSLSVRHDFYGRLGMCRDFVIKPTAATQILLRNLGLVAKRRPGGLDIFYHSGRAAMIVRHLCNRRDDHQQPGPLDLDRMKSSSWDRVTLTFTLDNHLFTNFTEMPFEVRPGRDCLYVSNRDASAGGGIVRLAADWRSRISIQPTQKVIFSSAYLHLPTRPDARHAVFYDTEGRAFLSADKVPDKLPENADKSEVPAQNSPHREQAAKRSEDPHALPNIGMVPGSNLHLDMTRQPAGRYSYALTPGEPGAEPGAETAFFYTGMDHAPLLMVDLFFDGPDDPPGGDRFPIKLPDKLPEKFSDDATEQAALQKYIAPRHYEIHFGARETIWIYYVVLPPGSTASDSLSIEVVKTVPPQDDARTLTFVRSSTTLAGRPASVFTAERPWQLQSRSDVSLRLRGAGAHGSGSDRILLDRLPLPTAEIMLPPRTKGGHAISEVFVYL